MISELCVLSGRTFWSFRIFHFLLSYGEVHRHDGVLGTFVFALAAEFALLVVDVGQVVGDGDSLEGAHLLTLAATDTAYLAGLACHGTLVLVHAEHHHAATIAALVAQLDDHARTCLHASTTSGTLVGIHLGESCLGIHANGVKLARLHAVATAQATIGAACLATTSGMSNLT